MVIVIIVFHAPQTITKLSLVFCFHFSFLHISVGKEIYEVRRWLYVQPLKFNG